MTSKSNKDDKQINVSIFNNELEKNDHKFCNNNKSNFLKVNFI